MNANSRKTLLIVVLAVALGFLIPGAATASWIGGIEFDHPSPSYLAHGEYIEVTIDCKVDDAEGARIYAVPYTDGAPTAGYGYSGGTVPFGESTVARFFTVNSGEPIVDHVKISMRSYDNSTPLMEFFVRVKFVFGDCAIGNVSTSHGDHAVLAHGTNLIVNFDYTTPGPEDVRVFARPYFDGNVVPGYSASGGHVGGPTGSGTQSFKFSSGDVDINQVRIWITDLAQSETLFEMYHAVDYAWREVGIFDISFSHPSPSMVYRHDDVTVTFNYVNPTGEEVRIWFLPFLDGDFGGPSHYQPSDPIPTGAGTLTRSFGATEFLYINQAALRVRRVSDGVDIVDRHVPVDYTFAPHVVTDVVMTPEPPALLDWEEILLFEFHFRTEHPDTVLIAALPYLRGDPARYWANFGCEILTDPIGTTDFETFTGAGSPDHEVDQFLFRLYDYDPLGPDPVLAEWFMPTNHLWGPSGTVTHVPETPAIVMVQMGQNYPNPFNPVTNIPVTLSAARHVRLAVYDLRGRRLRVLADEMMGPGRHEIPFEGTGLASGQYFYRLEGAGPAQTRSMMLVK